VAALCFLASVAASALANAPSMGDTASRGDLAQAASASASFVSGDTSLAALADQTEPASSLDNRRGSWGNWNRTGTQWVQYDWSHPVSTNKIAVYWWADHRGIKAPKACRLLYWDGSAFVPVGHPAGLGVDVDRLNVTTFDEVTTSRLRLEADGDGTFSTGVLRWRVIDSGKTAPFPPLAIAGPDRTVVLGARTFLHGRITSIESAPAVTVAWSKASGPGNVTFENAAAAETSATFSAVGDYVLTFSASQGSTAASSSLAVKVIDPAPADHLEAIYATRPWKIDSPLWNSREKALIVHWIPHCYEMLSRPGLKEGGIDNFIAAANKLAGKPHANRVGPPWSDAYVHNTIEAICVALMIDPQGDPEIIAAQAAMRRKLAEWIPIILAAQEPDGYLQTQFTLSGDARWSPRTRGNHEGYTGGYFIESALADYAMTGKADDLLYRAARKLADCWYDNIGPPPKKQWFDGHEEMEQALVRLGEFVNRDEGAGKGDKYIALAKFLLDCRRGGSGYDQSYAPVIQQYEAIGHAVRAVYVYSGMTGVAMETGDLQYQSAVQSIWDNLVNRKYYVTGGVGSGDTSEGFGADYALRNNGYCESCSGCGEIFFQHHLNLLYRDARYADLYEETLYNAVMGDVDLEGNNFYYQNHLDSGGARKPWDPCPCCVGNIPRTMLELPTWMYARAKDGLYVNLFVGGAVTLDDIAGRTVEIVQKTDYPWSGKVSIVVNPTASAPFTLHVRIPNRATSELYSATPQSNGVIALAVNGQAVTPAMDHGYAVIAREWKPGDRVDLEVPMPVQVIQASEKVKNDIGRVALRRGPIVYDIENADQDIGKTIDLKAPLVADWRGDLLDGVEVIRGQFVDGSPLLAIPYYARNNRGGNGSIVWIKSGDDAPGKGAASAR
jgi:DUF1680 family protein